MFYLYPANKMENLLALLNKIQQLSPLSVFAQETIIVQNAGMQHWLNMSLAQQRGISMNMRFALPSQFLWNLIRSLASEEDVPEQSPYSREVLAWRIDKLLASEVVVNDPDFSVATLYWQGASPQVFGEAEQLKRYQLACQLADLYEQYLIFRPEWIDAWHQGNFTDIELTQSSTENNEELPASNFAWQGKLWALLTQNQPYNPKELISLAIKNLQQTPALQQQFLPERISFFGINAMAPIWLEFINALSEKIDIHFFHLNPCYAYWGDIHSEKNAIEAWIKGQNHVESSTAEEQQFDIISDIHNVVGNPLLANLGQQGREFMALLYQYSTVNIDVFESAINDDKSMQPTASTEVQNKSSAILHQVQDDILTLSDARQTFTTHGKNKNLSDNSIIFTSAHSALREVQGLHDWLLHQFNQDENLTPKDILVMCPQVEQYAPYVNAVFSRGWQDIADDVPPLPCSIADRVSKDAEPLVAAFSELLTFPDSRFQVSSLMALLRLPALQKRFAIDSNDIKKISQWLTLASVHWGIDQQHKQQILATNLTEGEQLKNANANFTWQQGLARLMRGFAFGDSEVIYQDQLLLPNIEGSDSELLGKLMLIIEQLQLSAEQMTKPRVALNWQQYLTALFEQLFDDETDNGVSIIYQAIESLVEYCQHAEFEDEVPLGVIREFLVNHFSQPDPGRQFMVGQVTFCSMLPMRSIPFKVIAILGLNDGEFPRQRQPLSFDLMAETPAKLGDRSRRGDDRYLFLEAIISARQALYLSYQGRNIKNNKERQPSLVLKELMEYLARGYGWPLLELNRTSEQKSALRQLPLQAFSQQNYHGAFASFDANWFKLANVQTDLNDEIKADFVETSSDDIPSILEQQVAAKQLISFYQHPSRYYAQHNLFLYLDNQQQLLEDVEPFVADGLESYLLRQQLISRYLCSKNSDDEAAEIILAAKLAGKLPDLPSTDNLLQGWQQDSQAFSEYICNELAIDFQANAKLVISELDCNIVIKLDDETKAQLVVGSLINGAISQLELPEQVHIQTKLPIYDDKLVFYRGSSAKGKDLFTLYLHQLILQVAKLQASSNEEQGSLNRVERTYGYYFDTKSQKPSQYFFTEIAEPQQKLAQLLFCFHLGQQQPLLLNGELAEKVRKSKAFKQEQFEQFWHGNTSSLDFGSDAYLHYFWPHCPQYSNLSTLLLTVYQPLFDALQVVK